MDRYRRKVQVATLAERQEGRIGWEQMRGMGLTWDHVRSWERSGFLARRRPRVYVVGYAAEGVRGEQFEAVLYAGPKAALRCLSAAYQRRLIKYPPGEVQVATPRNRRAEEGIELRCRRPIARELVDGLPVTTVPQTLLDLAAAGEERLVRKALGRLEFRHELNLDQIAAACGPGRAGSPALRQALAHHDPRFAQSNGELAYDFLLLCEREGIPFPLVEAKPYGIQVDAYWPEAKLVVELDGGDAHGAWGQIKLDRSRELRLRRHGILVVRYTWDLVHERPHEVRDDLLRLLAERTTA